MRLMTQIQILDKAVCIHIALMTLGKVWIQLFSSLSLAMDKLVGRLGSLALVWQLVSEKENSEF